MERVFELEKEGRYQKKAFFDKKKGYFSTRFINVFLTRRSLISYN